MKRLFIGSMVMAILSLPTAGKAQETTNLGGSDAFCVSDMKVIWLIKGCKAKVGFACCA